MKKCTSCGKLNDDGMRFCEECGKELVKEAPKKYRTETKHHEVETMQFIDHISEKFGNFISKIISLLSGRKEKINVDSYINGTESIVPKKIKLCEGERLVKQYHCAQEKLAILGLKMQHFIQVTNQRIIYYKAGNSFFGPKEVQTEVPIGDVASISIERGFKINLLSLLFGGLQFYSYLLVALPTALVGMFLQKIDGLGIFTLIGAIALFALSFTDKTVTIDGTRYKLRDCFYYMSEGLMVSFILSLGNMGKSIFGTYSVNYKFASAIAIFAFVLMWIFSIKGFIDFLRTLAKQYFEIKVSSKSGSAFPIQTGGNEIFAINGDFLEAFIPVLPVGDARLMESELNTMVLDIQQLGDYGIEKWQEK